MCPCVRVVASPCRGESLASVLEGISMSFKSPMKLRPLELAMRVDRVHERVVDQSVDVTLPLKEELRVWASRCLRTRRIS